MNRHECVKKYYEEIAKEKLACFVDKKYAGLTLADKPDLQSDNLDIGIEVTQGISEEQGKTNAFLRETMGSDLTFEERKERMNRMGVKGWLYQSDDKKAICYGEIGDIPNIMQVLISTIAEKENKSDGYRKFKQNGLYLFCPSLLEQDDIEDIVYEIQIAYFDFCFFDCEYGVYEYDVENNVIQYFDLRFYQLSVGNRSL